LELAEELEKFDKILEENEEIIQQYSHTQLEDIFTCLAYELKW